LCSIDPGTLYPLQRMAQWGGAPSRYPRNRHGARMMPMDFSGRARLCDSVGLTCPAGLSVGRMRVDVQFGDDPADAREHLFRGGFEIVAWLALRIDRWWPRRFAVNGAA